MNETVNSRDRVILHCDCNSFFASVETVLNPEYKSVPMAVCGNVADRHGIVLAKNELAKKYGIQTAETVASAKRKCRGLVIASPHYGEYVKYSKAVNEIYASYTDMIEPFGIDESWLDVTSSVRLFGSGAEIADKIRREVKSRLGITVSVGVSFNKIFAKLGSDYKKPDAVTVIGRDNFRDIVYPLPVGALLFVGSKTAQGLAAMGIRTVGDLAQSDSELLKMRFGKSGEMIKKYALGEDDSPVLRQSEQAEQKSIGNGFTFKHDLVSREACRIGIDFLSEEIGYKLRKAGLKCSVVQLTIKDEYLTSIQRQRRVSPPTDISREIADAAYATLQASWSEGKPIRMLTVTVSGLIKADDVVSQIGFFDDGAEDVRREKNKRREQTVDKIRQRYGTDSITTAAIIDSDIGIYRKSDEKK